MSAIFAPAPPTPSPQAAAASDASSKRFTVARLTARALREAAREPDSIKFDSLRVDEDATTVCAEFRGRNGFGGVSIDHVVVRDGKADSSVASWNKHCTKPMYDYLPAAG